MIIVETTAIAFRKFEFLKSDKTTFEIDTIAIYVPGRGLGNLKTGFFAENVCTEKLG